MARAVPSDPSEKNPKSVKKSRSVRRTRIAYVGSLFFYMAFVVTLFIVFMLFGTNYLNKSGQSQLHEKFLTEQVPRSYLPPNQGSLLAQIYIPRINIDRVVVEGTSESDLIMGPGHYVGTPLPGQQGNVAIAGHRTTYGAPFYNLDKLRPGDLIEISTKVGTFHYSVVRSLIVSPSDNSVLAPSSIPVLTLTTCNPLFSASTRLVVVAKLIGPPIGTITKSKVSVPQASNLRTSVKRSVSHVMSASAAAIIAFLVGALGLSMISGLLRRRPIAGSLLVAVSFGIWTISFILGASLMPGSF